MVPGGGRDDNGKECFECNLCFNMPQEPVVTRCGHLYCWPCLYRRLQEPSQLSVCPACNAEVVQQQVIPIYGRGQVSDGHLKAQMQQLSQGSSSTIPPRPAGQRTAPVVVNSNQVNVAADLRTFLGGDPYASMDQVQQAFLSRLLLMLGSFVIMCLLLF
eukprot:jgi/Botrbrau1/7255/Bobra.0021s0037.1